MLHEGCSDKQAASMCSVAQSFGWAATPNILLLFYPVPRNSFLHWLFGTDFPGLVKYHRSGLCMPVTKLTSLYWQHKSMQGMQSKHDPVSNPAGHALAAYSACSLLALAKPCGDYHCIPVQGQE